MKLPLSSSLELQPDAELKCESITCYFCTSTFSDPCQTSCKYCVLWRCVLALRWFSKLFSLVVVSPVVYCSKIKEFFAYQVCHHYILLYEGWLEAILLLLIIFKTFTQNKKPNWLWRLRVQCCKLRDHPSFCSPPHVSRVTAFSSHLGPHQPPGHVHFLSSPPDVCNNPPPECSQLSEQWLHFCLLSSCLQSGLAVM